jgi:single-stranded DNA-specific DHH superfamily exonuclease
LIHYYNQNVFHSQELADDNSIAEQLLETEDEDDLEEKAEELLEILKERKKSNLH